MAASPTHKPLRRQIGYSSSSDLERDQRIPSSFSSSFLNKSSAQQNNCAPRQFSVSSTTSPVSYGQTLPQIHPTIPYYIGPVNDSSTHIGSEQTTPRHFSLIHASPVDQVTWWRSIERRAGACGKLLEGYSDACKFLQSPEDTALVLSEAIRNNDRGRAIWCEVMEVLGPFNKYCEGQRGQAPSPQGAYRMAAESLRSLEISDIYFKQQLEKCKELIQLQQKIKAAGFPPHAARLLSLEKHQTTTSPAEQLTRSFASPTKSLPATSPDRLFHYWSSPERRPLRPNSSKEHEQKRSRFVAGITQKGSIPHQKGYVKTSPSKEKLNKNAGNDFHKKSPRKHSIRGSRHGAQHVTDPNENGSANGRNDSLAINEQLDHKIKRPIQPSDIHNLFQLSKRDEATRKQPEKNDHAGTPDLLISYAGVAKEGARKSDADKMIKNTQRAPIVKAKQDVIEDITANSLGLKQITSVVQDHAVQDATNRLPHWPSVSSSYCTDSEKIGAQTAPSIIVRALIAEKQGDEDIKHKNKHSPRKQRGIIPKRLAPADIPPYIQQASKTAAEHAGCSGSICHESEAEIYTKQSTLEHPVSNGDTVSFALQKANDHFATMKMRPIQARAYVKRETLSIPSGVELGLVSRKRNSDFQASKCQIQEMHMAGFDSSTMKQSLMEAEEIPHNNGRKAAHSCQAELTDNEVSTPLSQDEERMMFKHEAIPPAKIWPHEDPAREVRENESRQHGDQCDTGSTYAYKSVEKYTPTKPMTSWGADVAHDVHPSTSYLPEKGSGNLEPPQHKPLNNWPRRVESISKSSNITTIKVASPKSNLLSVSIPVRTAGNQEQNKRDDTLAVRHRDIHNPKSRVNLPPRLKSGGGRGHAHIESEPAGYPFKRPASTAVNVQGHGKGTQPQSKDCTSKATTVELITGRSQNRFNDLASSSSSSTSISTSSATSSFGEREEKPATGGRPLVRPIGRKKGNKPRAILPSASLTVSNSIKSSVSKFKKKKDLQFVEIDRHENDVVVSSALPIDNAYETQQSEQSKDSETHTLRDQATKAQEYEQDDQKFDNSTNWISLTSKTDFHDSMSSNAKTERVRKLLGYLDICAKDKGEKNDANSSSASSDTSRPLSKPIKRIKSKGAKAHKLRQGRQGIRNLTQRPPAMLATNFAVSASEAGADRTAAVVGSASSTACNTDSSEIDQPPAYSYRVEHDTSSDSIKIRRLSVRSQQFQVVCAASERMQVIADGIKEEQHQSSASSLNDNGQLAREAVSGLGLTHMDVLEKRLTSAEESPSGNASRLESIGQHKMELAGNEPNPEKALISSIEECADTGKVAPRRRIRPILVPRENKISETDRLVDVTETAATNPTNTVANSVPPPAPKLPTTPTFLTHPSSARSSSASSPALLPGPSKTKRKRMRQEKNKKLRASMAAEGKEQGASQDNRASTSGSHISVGLTNSSMTVLSEPSTATFTSKNDQDPPSSACDEILSFLDITSNNGPVKFSMFP